MPSSADYRCIMRDILTASPSSVTSGGVFDRCCTHSRLYWGSKHHPSQKTWTTSPSWRDSAENRRSTQPTCRQQRTARQPWFVPVYLRLISPNDPTGRGQGAAWGGGRGGGTLKLTRQIKYEFLHVATVIDSGVAFFGVRSSHYICAVK